MLFLWVAKANPTSPPLSRVHGSPRLRGSQEGNTNRASFAEETGRGELVSRGLADSCGGAILRTGGSGAETHLSGLIHEHEAAGDQRQTGAVNPFALSSGRLQGRGTSLWGWRDFWPWPFRASPQPNADRVEMLPARPFGTIPRGVQFSEATPAIDQDLVDID